MSCLGWNSNPRHYSTQSSTVSPVAMDIKISSGLDVLDVVIFLSYCHGDKDTQVYGTAANTGGHPVRQYSHT